MTDVLVIIVTIIVVILRTPRVSTAIGSKTIIIIVILSNTGSSEFSHVRYAGWFRLLQRLSVGTK